MTNPQTIDPGPDGHDSPVGPPDPATGEVKSGKIKSGPAPGTILASVDRFGRNIAGGGGDGEFEPGQQRSALVRLLAGIAVIVALAAVTHALTVLAVIVAIIVFVLLHELGHFATAKWSGMKVTEYFVGFGPRLWSIRRGETEYGVKAIPAGGYVRIIGMTNLEEVDPADEARSYRQQSFPKRLSVAAAGSMMHFIIAFVLLFVLYAGFGVTTPRQPLTVGNLLELTTGASPAQQAGLRPGDRILTAGGVPVKSFDQFHDLIAGRAGTQFPLQVQRGKAILQVNTTPTNGNLVVAVPLGSTPAQMKTAAAAAPPDPSLPSAGFLGFEPANYSQRANPLVAVGRSAQGFGHLVVGTMVGMGHVFSPHGLSSLGRQVVGGSKAVTTTDATDRASSVVGVVRVTAQAAKQGPELVFLLLAGVNIFIGIFNLFPLLPFDGGHVVIAIYERLRSRRGRRYHADVARMLPAIYPVMAVLLFVFASTIILDVSQPINLPR
jgi:membrane-associated protease RseP (regulator of RpoE activity)